MAAVVIRFDIATWLLCVGVEGIQVRADAFHWSKVLIKCERVCQAEFNFENEELKSRRKVVVPELRKRRSPESC